MRITRFIADTTAEKMVAEKVAANDKKWDAFLIKAKKVYMSQIPKIIQEASNKHPEFFDWNESIRMGPRFGWDHLSLPEGETIVEYSSNKSPITNAPKSKLDPLVKEYDKIVAEKRENQKLEKNLANALYELRTRKKVEISIPEAAPFLPESTEVAVADYSKLRKELVS